MTVLDNEQCGCRDMQLREEPSLDQGGSVVELSRPAHALKKRLQEQNRKPQGQKAFRQSQKTKYHNWFTPFLFKQIENARIVAGGPKWSTSAIVKELQKHNYKTFKALSRTTINEWINRSDRIPKWSERTIERVHNGNQVGSNGGCRGILVSTYNYECTCNEHIFRVDIPKSLTK